MSEPVSPAPDAPQPDAERTPAEPTPGAEALQAELAERLRAARTRRGATIEQAAEALRIRRAFLEALEAADWSKLPDAVYARGFARQYARWLGVEIDDLLAHLAEPPRLQPPATYPDAPIAPDRRIAIGAAALLIALLAWAVWPSDEDAPPPAPSAETIPAAPPPTGSAAGETATPTVPPSPSASAAAKAPPAPTPAAPPAAHRYEIRAVGGPLWFQLRDPTAGDAAPPVKEAMLRPGESVVVEDARPALILVAGDAAAVEAWVDGQRIVAPGALGPRGKVRRARLEAPANGRQAAATASGGKAQ